MVYAKYQGADVRADSTDNPHSHVFSQSIISSDLPEKNDCCPRDFTERPVHSRLFSIIFSSDFVNLAIYSVVPGTAL